MHDSCRTRQLQVKQKAEIQNAPVTITMTSIPAAALPAPLVVVIRLILMAVARQTGRATRVVAAIAGCLSERRSARSYVVGSARRCRRNRLCSMSHWRAKTPSLYCRHPFHTLPPPHTPKHTTPIISRFIRRAHGSAVRRNSGSGPVAIGKVMRRLRLYDSNKVS